MYEQDDLDFVDILYQQWSATTGVKGNQYWMPEEDESFPGSFTILATQGGEGRNTPIAAFLEEADADFITGLHGALPDLVRRLHELIDENERLDEARDAAERSYADALLESESHQNTIMFMEDAKGLLRMEIKDLKEKVEELENRMWIE